MKLFQQLLLAPAALGLMAPIAANAADLNIDQVSDYASGSEVQNFSDVYPTDWAFKALTSLAERHGCAVATPEGSITRFEAATLVEKCLGNVAQANEEERRLLNEFAPEIAVIKGRLDGLESRVGEFEAGQFSKTTTLTGKAAFVVGNVATDMESTEATTFEYSYVLNMNTSFTGDDLLYTRLKSANMTSSHWTDKTNGTYLAVAGSSSDQLKVDKIWYQFPVGENLQFWFGPRVENYYMLASSPSNYKPILKQFALGGNGTVYGSHTTGGFGAAWTQTVEDPSEGRFAVSAAYTSKGSSTSTDDNGLFGKDSATGMLVKTEYGTPRWQVSLAGAFKEGAWNDEYFATNDIHARDQGDSQTNYGLRGYWSPEDTGILPAVTVGYDTMSTDDADSGEANDGAGWMIGLSWKDVIVDGNSAGFALGSRVHGTEINGGGTDPAEDTSTWEAYYTFQVNDNVSVTPAVFGNSEPSDGDSDGDNTGVLVLTNFRF